MASVVLVLFWAAMALFFIDLAWLYASQFLYYILYGTKYDTVPWLLSWMTNDAFIVTPGVDSDFSASGNNDGFTPEQWQQIYNLLLLEWVLITLINQSTVVPPLAAASEDSFNVATDKAAVGGEPSFTSSGPVFTDSTPSSSSNNTSMHDTNILEMSPV